MTRHARKPALIVLLTAVALAAAGMAATGQFRAGHPPASLEELEKAIGSGSADAGTWNAYGDALRGVQRFGHAAAAYQRSLELDPDRPMARFNLALALGQAGDADKFFLYFAQVTANDPKQAVDLLERPELEGLHKDGRWAAAATNARAQAAD
jgi:tetratricopeptide (TPR) repeat protein